MRYIPRHFVICALKVMNDKWKLISSSILHLAWELSRSGQREDNLMNYQQNVSLLEKQLHHWPPLADVHYCTFLFASCTIVYTCQYFYLN